jgi:hypothetical protein
MVHECHMETEAFLSPHVRRATRAKVRKHMIDLVLATDMKQHFALLSQFKSVYASPSVAAERSPLQAWQQDMPSPQAVSPVDDTERLLSLQVQRTARRCALLLHAENAMLERGTHVCSAPCSCRWCSRPLTWATCVLRLMCTSAGWGCWKRRCVG